MTDHEMAKAVWRKRKMGDERRPVMFMPKEWWDAEYQSNPRMYYRMKHVTHTALFCSVCENAHCGWAIEDIEPIITTGKCRYCSGTRPMIRGFDQRAPILKRVLLTLPDGRAPAAADEADAPPQADGQVPQETAEAEAVEVVDDPDQHELWDCEMEL
jgi:hypothetical protein